MIVEDLLDRAEDELKDRKVVDVRIGLSYAGVLLDDEKLGLAYSFREEAIGGSEVSDDAGKLEGDARKLARLSLASNVVDSSVGLATLNAAFNRGFEGNEGDIFDFLDLKGSDRVGMVGDFEPLIGRMDDVSELYVFERNPWREGVYPDWATERILPEVDVAIISGSTLINKTIDHLLELAGSAREVVVLGPSTALAPDLFEARGVTMLGGLVVENVNKAMKIIGQAGGTRKLGEVSRKITLDLKA